jgi:hypothetical protein
MLPPWVAFPMIPRGSIGWRMGPGEDYISDFYKWYLNLNDDERKKYKEKFASQTDEFRTSGWADYLNMLESIK